MAKNKYVNGILPMVLINFAIGSVYCWTLFKEHVQEYTGFSDPPLDWAFSIAIFFLGMSAAFGGKIVEKNPRVSAWLTAGFFTAGWLITGLGIQLRNPWIMLIGFGPIQGLALGLGYITPVKTMMIWMENAKGFAAGLSIAAFGLAGVIANPLIEWMLQGFAPHEVFYILAVAYGIGLVAAAMLLYRPPYVDDNPVILSDKFSAWSVISSGKFLFLWLIFFLNIAGGLALISREKQIYNYGGGYPNYLALVMITAFANLAGRMIMSTLQDHLKLKHLPYYLMVGASLGMALLAATKPQSVAISFSLVFVIQFMFGCGFACMPNILHQNWGMKYLSTVHGLVLSAWAIAGLVGNQVSSFVMRNYSLRWLFVVLTVVYAVEAVALLIWVTIRRRSARQIEAAQLAAEPA
ncbi:MAG: MFS transporter [Promicromonosporaceae bacterium]|nr:MFS transporter [Promicromonosporaceae bacterium]